MLTTPSSPAPSTDTRPRAGATVWLTGLPSAGKTTVAKAVAGALAGRGVPTELLDGDEVRANLSRDLGFSRADRAAQVGRVGYVARLLARHGVVVFAPLVSPYSADRDLLRAAHEAEGLRFLEIHVAAPVDVCAVRDVKGLYAKQAAGEMTGLTGVDDVYEAPVNADLVLATHAEPLADSVARMIDLLTDQGLA